MMIIRLLHHSVFDACRRQSLRMSPKPYNRSHVDMDMFRLCSQLYGNTHYTATAIVDWDN